MKSFKQYLKESVIAERFDNPKEYKIGKEQFNKALEIRSKIGQDNYANIISKRYYNKSDANKAKKELEKKYNITLDVIETKY